MCESGSPEIVAPRETDCGDIGNAEPVIPRRRPMSTPLSGTGRCRFPGVLEDGMSGQNVQRKPGTTRGSPRRSRTAKASRISRNATKSRCACEWGGWGRLSVDGPGHYNPDPSEGPWGGGVTILHGGVQSSLRPDTVRDNRVTTRRTKGGCKPSIGRRMPGAGLSRR
jgi:hypothetical protein